MFTKLLLVAIIISCNTLVKGFAKFHCFSLKINSKTKLNIGLTSSCFDDDDENRNNKQKKITTLIMDMHMHMILKDLVFKKTKSFYKIIKN